jgi:O-6-methylguanine DNA methyltransferase
LSPRKSSFREKVLAVVAQISGGQVKTYAQIARLSGHPRAYRVVGQILSRNFNPQIPCHRVIRADGQIGGYNRGFLLKRGLLRREGGRIVSGRFIKRWVG